MLAQPEQPEQPAAEACHAEPVAITVLPVEEEPATTNKFAEAETPVVTEEVNLVDTPASATTNKFANTETPAEGETLQPEQAETEQPQESTEPAAPSFPFKTGEKPDDEKKAFDDKLKRLFIGGVSYETNRTQFEEYFASFGELEDIILMKRREEPQHRGFGFVTYKEAEAANNVINQTHELHGKLLSVNAATRRTKRLYVAGLPPGTESKDLQEEIEKFIEVQDVYIHHSGKFSFVTVFENGDAVDKLLNSPGLQVKGNTCHIKLAYPKQQSGFGRGRGNGPPFGVAFFYL